MASVNVAGSTRPRRYCTQANTVCNELYAVASIHEHTHAAAAVSHSIHNAAAAATAAVAQRRDPAIH